MRLGAPMPHLHRDLARACDVCTGTWLTPPTAALRLVQTAARLGKQVASSWQDPTDVPKTDPQPACGAVRSGADRIPPARPIGVAGYAKGVVDCCGDGLRSLWCWPGVP
jgi:hypothetical protein